MPVSTTVLQRIEAENKLEPQWIVGPQAGQFLHDLVLKEQPQAIVEIGTSVGYSAIWMGSALKEIGQGKMWTIESHEERFVKAEKNIEEAGLKDWVVQIKGHAPEVFEKLNSLPLEIDLAFIDATKHETPLYIEALRPRLKKGGWLLIDNVQSHRFGVMAETIEKLYKDPHFEVREETLGGGLLLARFA